MATHARPTGGGRRRGGEIALLVRWALLPTAVFLAVVLGLYGGTGHDLTIILQDRFPEDSEWSGLLTILFGSALVMASGVALSGTLLARPVPAATVGGTPGARAALAVAALAAVIAFDDMMMIHDAVLPGAGISEDVGLAAYGAVGVVLALCAVRPLRRVGLDGVFVIALALLAGSLGGDVLEDVWEGPHPALAVIAGHAEDVTKFVAYAALCHLCVRLALRSTPRPSEPPPGARAGDEDPLTVPLVVAARVP